MIRWLQLTVITPSTARQSEIWSAAARTRQGAYRGFRIIRVSYTAWVPSGFARPAAAGELCRRRSTCLSRWSRGGVVAELNHKKFSSAVQMIWSLRGVDGSGSSAHTQHLSHTSPPPQPPSCHASSSRLWRCHVPLRRPAALHSPSASAAVLTHPVRRGASSPRQLSGRAAGRSSTTTASTATASKSWRSPT